MPSHVLYIDLMQKILSTANAKISKSKKLGFFTVGIHFAPYNLSGRNVCPFASNGCAAACLNTAGYGALSAIQQARINKTKQFFSDVQGFMVRLAKEIAAAEKKAQKNGMHLAVRLNLTSDIAWEKIMVDGKNIFQQFPKIQFYDYTKNPNRMELFISGNLPPNYHLTFSRNETNNNKTIDILNKGGNAAVVFRGSLPATWNGFTVVNGDNSDLRFLDPKSCVVGLLQKGKAKKDQSGFVVSLD